MRILRKLYRSFIISQYRRISREYFRSFVHGVYSVDVKKGQRKYSVIFIETAQGNLKVVINRAGELLQPGQIEI